MCWWWFKFKCPVISFVCEICSFVNYLKVCFNVWWIRCCASAVVIWIEPLPVHVGWHLLDWFTLAFQLSAADYVKSWHHIKYAIDECRGAMSTFALCWCHIPLILVGYPLLSFRLFHHVCCCFVPNLILFFFVRILDVVCFTTWLSYSMLLLNCLIWLDLIWSHLSAFVSIMSLILLTLNWSVLLTVVIRCSRCSVHSKEFGSVWFDSLSPAWSQGLIWSIAVQYCCLIFSALGCNPACVLERPDTLPWTLPWSIR